MEWHTGSGSYIQGSTRHHENEGKSILGGCCARCMLYSAYAVLCVCCTLGMLY